jgi:transcriptional regulator with XRE-family HTH domain
MDRRHKVDSQVGSNIQRRREALSMHPADLADILGVSEAEVLAWEAGEARLPAALFIPCARALSVPATSLIDGVEDIEQTTSGGPFDYLIY